MIVSGKRSWFRLLLSLRGSVLGVLALRLLVVVAFAGGIAWFDHQNPGVLIDITLAPFTLVGLALSIFLGFRNNTSYDRFWEGRKLLGALINETRSMARLLDAYIGGDGREPYVTSATRSVIGYAHALRAWLRFQDPGAEAAPFVDGATATELRAHSNPPVAILEHLSRQLTELRRAGAIDAYAFVSLQDKLSELTSIQGGCERIRNTPIPFAYTVLMHRIVAAYCFLLPIGLVHTLGFATPAVVLFISYAFFGLDAIGDEIEEPFGLDPNDLPFQQLTTVIERDLRSSLGDLAGRPELPPMEPGNIVS